VACVTDQNEAESFGVEFGEPRQIVEESRLFADEALTMQEVIVSTQRQPPA